MVTYLILLTVLLPVAYSGDTPDYLRDQKEFQYDYYDDIIFPAKMGKESIRESSEEPKNLCNLVPPASPMFCKCADNDLDVTCFIFTRVSESDMVWDLFGDKSSIAKLRFNSRPEGSLTFVPSYALEHLQNLQNMAITHAKISVVKTFAFARLSSLVGMDLAKNDIEFIEEKGFAHLHNLVELLLSENLLTTLNARSFVDLPRLRILFLDRNNISRIEEGTFSDMPDLTELELWGNTLTEINPDSFKGLLKLHHFDLSYNRITQLNQNAFATTPKLVEINLQHNFITLIEDSAFDGLDQLMRLRLASNQLTSLSDPSPFVRLPRLMLLDLKNNQLETLNANSILNLANVHNSSAYIHIEGNPFKCSCNLHWMVTFMNSSLLTPLREELAAVKCHQRENDDFIPLLQVPWDDLGCNPKPTTTKSTKSTATSYKYEVAAIAPFAPTDSDTFSRPNQVKPTIPSETLTEDQISIKKDESTTMPKTSGCSPITTTSLFLAFITSMVFVKI